MCEIDLTPFLHRSGFRRNTSNLALTELSWPGNHIHHKSTCNHRLHRDQEKWICRRRIHIHLEFWTRATRFRFAREPKILLTPPLRKPEIWAIRTVGTTSWFLDPISAYWKLMNMYHLRLDLSTYRCKHSELLRGHVTQICSIELHDDAWNLLCQYSPK